jgi:site-specific DNA recombinase
MTTSTPRRAGGRTLIDLDPGSLSWVLLARESVDRSEQVNNQITDLRARVAAIGGRIDREIPENAVSAYKRKRVPLPDGTYGYRVVRPEWEKILTALRRGECNALLVTDIDRAMRDPRTLEDLIDAVEYYGVHVESVTGNIDLTTDAGISAARTLVNQRNQESRNKSRLVADGQRHARMKGRNLGGPMRPFGWRKDRTRVNKRESALIRATVPRILAGLSCGTLAQEWNAKRIPTVTGAEWRTPTVRKIFLNPRLCGMVIYRGEILHGPDDEPVRGEWEPILTDDEYAAVRAKLAVSPDAAPSRLEGKGKGSRTSHLLSPFVRCGKCGAKMTGTTERNRKGETETRYRCPSKGNGGCGGIAKPAKPVEEYIKALAEQQKIEFRALEDAEAPEWRKARELADLQARINEQQRRYESGQIVNAERHFSSLSRMEADEARLKREKREWERPRQARRQIVANLAAEWDRPDFTLEQKQAAIAQTLTAIVLNSGGKGVRFHHSQITPVFRDEG